MGAIRMRYLAQINPSTPQFDQVSADCPVTFVPLEAVWAGGGLDLSRERVKREVSTGYTRFVEGDILVPKVAPTFQAARVAVVDQMSHPVGAGSTELHVVRPHAGVDRRYVAYGFQSSRFVQQGVASYQGVAGLQRVPDMLLKDFEVAHVSLAEQRRIADFLDDQVARIDETIRLREEQMVALEERFALALQHCFDPAGAPSVPLRRVVADLQTGSTPTVDDVQETNETIGWYTPNSFGMLAKLNEPMKYFPSELTRAAGMVRFHGPAVLFVGIGWASGRVAYLDRPGSGNQQLTAIYPNELIRPRFLLWQLHHAGPHIRRIAPFTVLPVLSNDFLKSVPIVLPDLNVQDESLARIERHSESLLQMRGESSAEIGLLEERKRSLITAAVTGQLDVSTASGREVMAG